MPSALYFFHAWIHKLNNFDKNKTKQIQSPNKTKLHNWEVGFTVNAQSPPKY